MRLKQIKLAGFKSFVDPTAFEVPSQLVGVVGPNGCGKSNVMDAVRWVLGESRASELRGESMQDVIFNGSSERKPASRASVELVFDNSLGRIGGSWAQYAEISVRRVLTRDGQSTYLINNQAVRRKDVHDMFLGTGLGPRAYAIIGQGMISRIIEAKPEEMRVFLEEAAGVSKYKERRRETENRLSDTRENLTRVEDILRELDAQIGKLERQAEVAQQYRRLEADRERRQQMLWIVRRDEALADQARVADQVAAATIALEARIADLRAAELDLEQLRADQYSASDQVHQAQSRFYETNAEVAKLEAEIRYVVEAQAQMRERSESLEAQRQRAADDRETAGGAAADAESALADAHLRAEALSERVSLLADELPAVESRLRDARERVDAARAEAMSTGQQIELSATRRRAAESSMAEAQRREERLQSESAGIDAPDDAAAEAMAMALERAQAAEQVSADALAAADGAWREADARRAPAQQALREAEGKLAQIEARMSALRQLQDRIQSQGKINPWLARHGLDRLGRLWQRLRIEHGWETAIESLLRERVGALQVERLESLVGLVDDAPPAKVSFFAPAIATVPSAAPLDGLRAMSSLVHCNDAALQAIVADWLHGVWAAASLEEAVSRRASLPAGGCLVTGAGHLVDRHAIRIYAPDSEQDGLLARQFEIDNLERELRAQRMLADDARDAATRAEAAAADGMARLSEARETHTMAVRQLSTQRLDAERLEQARARAQATRERVDAELADVMQAQARAQAIIDEESEAFDRLDVALAERQQLAEDLAEALHAAESALAAHRESLRQAEREMGEAAFQTRELQSRIERLREQALQAESLIEQSALELATLAERLAALSDEAARAGLQQALDQRTLAEQALAAARGRLDDITLAMRARDEGRLALERDLEPMRQRLTELQLKEQAARLNADQFSQQLFDAHVDEGAVRATFEDATPKAGWLQGEVTRLSNALTELGPVNLAALDELAQGRERKGFLDAQLGDLNEAIATLEDAIRKIDRETRELLKDTYDTVNRHFGTLFPELFGGGEARLILTGEEILDAGVQVMAQPPGKRNSSIHLLSGGEKALTAIALVFALFHLNPAPFCLLDEVDAPLDDANTERYADMVRRMSDHTQFLFITHNKIAMEMAQQLVGVTMQERGVSRIVAVDLDSAAKMVEAA